MDNHRKVLITGGMGFIGSHLSEALLADGMEVTVLDNLTTGRRQNVAHLIGQPGFRAIVGDVEDRTLLDDLVSRNDLVIHLAAVLGVELIVADPIRTIETNIQGTSSVLAATNRYGVKTLVASTSEVYGKSPQLPFQEDADVVLGATSRNRWAYAASKMVDEFLGLAYHEQHGLPVVVFRLFNTVGPRQSGRYGMVIPRFVQAALAGRPVPIHGDGKQTRSFLHVLDAVAAIRGLAADERAVGTVFNVGSSNPLSIEQLAERVLERVDKWSGASPVEPWTERVRYIPYDVAYQHGFEDMRDRLPDTTRVRALTGWSSSRTLDDILDDVIESFAGKSLLRVN